MKKLNIALIILLLVFQTVMTPVSAFASEEGSLPDTIGEGTNAQNDINQGDDLVSDGNGGEDNDDGNDPEDSTNQQEAPSDTDVTADSTPAKEEEEKSDITDEKKEETEELENPQTDFQLSGMMGTFNEPPATCEKIEASLEDFELTIDGTKVATGYSKELEQNQEGQAKFKFSLNLEKDDCWQEGSSFKFSMPTSILKFKNSNELAQTLTKNGVKFLYWYANGEVTVTLQGDVPEESVGTHANIDFTFGTYFDFTGYGDSVTQDVVIPTAPSGIETIPVTFIPKDVGKTMTKENTSSGVVINDDGTRTMDWVVWVNKDGKNLSEATLEDDMTGGTGTHELNGDITVESFTVGLAGVTGSVQSTNTYNSFEEITLNGRNAYKITYQTIVNLPIAEQVGKKTFGNTIKLKGSVKDSATVSPVSTTYGEPLQKFKDTSKTNNNYESNWYIDYNFNRATIPAAQATIEDRLTGNPTHVIDTSSIEVYEVTVNDSGEYQSEGPELTLGSDYTVDDTVSNGFDLAFTNDINKAYRIYYKATYEDDFYVGPNQTIFKNDITNTVTSGTVTTANSKTRKTHTLTEGILTKSRVVDFENKLITWTIKVKADNKEISGLKLTDVFTAGTANGTHNLVKVVKDGEGKVISVTDSSDSSDISVSNMSDYTTTLTENGFTIEEGTIAAGQTATITYTTRFEIAHDGSVAENGFGNTITADWTSDNPYSLTKTSVYKPEETHPTTKNGNKWGEYDYVDQKFNWKVVVNTNKVSLNGATLKDTIGAGHQLVGDENSIKIYEYRLTNPNDDDNGTKYEPLTSKYNVSLNNEGKDGFIITFDNDMGSANNKTYIIEYQTEDEDNIIGISDATVANPSYNNTAVFTTQGKTTTLGNIDLTVDFANSLLEKKVITNNASSPIMKWQLDVNKSHSSLGQTTVQDTPSGYLMLIKDSIQLREYEVSPTGITSGSTWVNAADVPGVTVNYTEDGGFVLTFDDLTKKGYEVQYETLVLSRPDDGQVDNTALMTFAGSDSLADNQKKKRQYPAEVAYHYSDANFSLTKGDLKFIKKGVNPLTGDSKPLAGVEFQLIKKIAGKNHVIAKATSDENGYVEFKNVNYGGYTLREVADPVVDGDTYKKSADIPVTLKAENDYSLLANTGLAAYEVKNIQDVGSAPKCPNFTLTIKDLNGKPVANTQIKLVDGNGNEPTLTNNTTNANGQILIPDTVQAGEYKVVTSDDKDLGKVTVKFGVDCQGEIAPIPSCPSYTVTLMDGNGPRKNVKVTIKDALGGNVVATETTNEEGEFTLPTTTPAGKYYAYESNQFLGVVNVDYLGGNCGYEFIQAPKCEVFTLTVRDVDGEIRESTEVVIKDKETKAVIATKITDENGQITIDDLKPGAYEVYEADGTTFIDEFTSNIDCEASVQPKPTCPVFSIILKDKGGNPRQNVKVTITNGTESFERTTDSEGKVTLPSNTTPAGDYDVYQGELYIGKITVSYKDTCQGEVSATPSCPIFTLTLHNSANKPREGVEVTIKDAKGKNVEITVEGQATSTFKTGADGKVTLPASAIQQGKYNVYEGTKLINSFTVFDTCEVIVKPRSSGGGGGTPPPTPEDPNEPGEDPNNPSDPNEPNPNEPGKDPNEPNDPNGPGEDPNNPNEPGELGKDPDNSGKPGIVAEETANAGNNGTVHGVKDSKTQQTNIKDGKVVEKLPQTDGNSSIYIMLTGALLILISSVLLFRRKKEQM